MRTPGPLIRPLSPLGRKEAMTHEFDVTPGVIVHGSLGRDLDRECPA